MPKLIDFSNKQDGENSTFLNAGIKFKGEIFTKMSINIQTSIVANITSLSTVVVEKNGRVTGNITASSFTCNGEVNGNIQTSNVTQIKSTGKVTGNITSQNLITDMGSSIKGECKIIKIDK